MIEKLQEFNEHEKDLYPIWLQYMHEKLNEIIDAHNDHFHALEEHRLSTGNPKYEERLSDDPADGLPTEPES